MKIIAKGDDMDEKILRDSTGYGGMLQSLEESRGCSDTPRIKVINKLSKSKFLVSQAFKYLFSPVELGPIIVKNRIYISPHATMFASDDRDNLPGDRLSYYCAERAKGGVGLIEVSMGRVTAGPGQAAIFTDSHFSPLNLGHPMDLTGRFPIRASDPRVVEGYSKLGGHVHKYGAKCFIELSSAVTSGMGVSPYPLPSHPIHALPFTRREMDEATIEGEIEAFGMGAKLVRDSGLDGIDLHGTHGALISQFLSGVMNRRKDKWGGSLENRMRFLQDIIKRVKEYTNGEIAVGMRLMGDERYEGGNTPEVAAQIASSLDGKVDWITADRGYSPHQEDWQAVPMYVDSGYNLRITNPIKAVLKKTKTGVVGKYTDPGYAESLIANGQADLVAMTRALIADPDLPNKARDGRLTEIRPCIGVLQDCWGRMLRGLPISCTVNPAAGREETWGMDTLTLAIAKKNVFVIGGGVAGLETARIAALRGHRVKIYEKSRLAGGQAMIAGKLPGRSNLKAIVSWLTDQVKALGVDIRYGLEVTDDQEVVDYILNEEKPDVVVIATGSSPIKNGFQPYTFNEIEGWNQPNVCTDEDIWEGRVQPGQKILIADTLSFIEAPGLAEHLAKQGMSVEVVTPFENIALELNLMNHWEHLLPRLLTSGVKITPFTWIKKIEKNSVVLYNFYEKQNEMVRDVDNIVLITGRMQNDTLYQAFKKKIGEVYLAGDANVAGARIGFAMHDGQRIGRLV